MMVARCLAAAALGCVAALVSTGAAAETIEAAQLWTTLSGSGSIKGDIVGRIDLNVRTSADQGRVAQTLTCGTIGYRVKPALTLSLGYGHITGSRLNRRDLAEERLYQQVQVQVPLRPAGPALVVQAAPLFAFDSTDWGARTGFDQVRALTGANIPITKTLNVETGYQVQYVRGAAFDRVNHIVPVTLSWRF